MFRRVSGLKGRRATRQVGAPFGQLNNQECSVVMSILGRTFRAQQG